MIDLAPLLGVLVGAVLGGRRMVIFGPGVVAFGLDVLGFIPGRPPHCFSSRHCLVESDPIGSRGYATGVEFAAHLSKAGGFSQRLSDNLMVYSEASRMPGSPVPASFLFLTSLSKVRFLWCWTRSHGETGGGSAQ